MSHQNFNNQISDINSNRGLTDLLLSPVKEITTGFPSQWEEPLSKQAHLLFSKKNGFYNGLKNLQITASTVSQKHKEDRTELKRHPDTYQRSLLVLRLDGPPGNNFIIHPKTLSTTSSPSSA